MSAELDRCQQLADRGDYRKAARQLWQVGWKASQFESEAVAMSELAVLLRDRTDGRTRRECERLIERARYYLLQHEGARAKRLETPEGEAEEGALAIIRRCEVLGGHGFPTVAGDSLKLLFMDDELVIWRVAEIARVEYAAVTAIQVGGPGETQSGGGFIGGGFGLEGIAEGMLIAGALNMLTTESRTDTVICIQTRTSELFLHNREEIPDTIRIRLSPVFSKLRQLEGHATPAVGDSPKESVIDQLAKLGTLLDRGLIDEDEFKNLKSQLLSTSQMP